MQNYESGISAEYEKMLAEALQQPGVQTVVETMRLVREQEGTMQRLAMATASSYLVTAGTSSVQPTSAF